MALDKSALSELLDAIRAGEGTDAIRESLEFVLQALIELEAAIHIGAGRYERTERRTTHRDGNRSRVLSTKAGDVNLSIPKLREGSFFPALLEPSPADCSGRTKRVNMGVGVALGAGIGTAMFAATNDAWWIAAGAGIGVVMGAVFQSRNNDE